jgi:hypothetical protein
MPSLQNSCSRRILMRRIPMRRDTLSKSATHSVQTHPLAKRTGLSSPWQKNIRAIRVHPRPIPLVQIYHLPPLCSSIQGRRCADMIAALLQPYIIAGPLQDRRIHILHLAYI